MSSAGSDTASCVPWRSTIAPRWAGTVTVVVCCEAARWRSEPPLTAARYAVRTPASASSTRKTANSCPTRRSVVGTLPPGSRDRQGVEVAHTPAGDAGVEHATGGQEARLAGRRHHQAHPLALERDAVARRQARDLGLQGGVLARERAGLLQVAADAGVELEQHELQGDDPDQRKGDQADPRPPAYE